MQVYLVQIKKIVGEDFDVLMIKLGNLHILWKGLDCAGITGSVTDITTAFIHHSQDVTVVQRGMITIYCGW